ncbi:MULTISPECIES: DUF4275 family protein [Brevibacillus]|uniref:DUF4275 family protein n=1 Tax=Brevibacillus TaxID=55080 RepID=UPI001134245B|nr:MULTISPECIES: DUF4275 family protein [Brevibacillus]TGV23406.1 DUF4275 family protein [Mesorhizobium sp. M00.F.Ca.ET.186.01.1.1]MED1723806.1 DUF4275 family protein [Brevibacillus parabrevis]MED2256979.1 DUF4275 family protein [Brevibacillus parabrevis]NRQ56541.1 DUF4275 family protein [Brevibacillus sp. HD1.4A]UED69213.1 DUF4275 family protein [Brevibacillus sp. HD3.3A]
MKLTDCIKEKKLKATELEIWGPYLRKEWENHFASHLSEEEKQRINLNRRGGFQGYLWHLFSYRMRDCLQREEADQAFRQVSGESCYVFYQLSNKVWIMESPSQLSVEDLAEECDVYVVDKQFTWTYVRTHEKEWCGPYFCRR